MNELSGSGENPVGRLALPALPMRRVTGLPDRDEPDDLHPSALRLVIQECLRFSAGEVLLIEQTWGEELLHASFANRLLPASLIIDFDVRRQRADLFEPIAEEFPMDEEFSGAVLDDPELDFESAATPPGVARSVVVFYSCLYPLLLGVKKQALVDFNVAAARKAAETLATHALGSRAKQTAAAVASVLSTYRRESMTGLAFSRLERVGSIDAALDMLTSDDFRRMAGLAFQLGVPDLAGEILPQLAAMAKRLSAQVDHVKVTSSPILVPGPLPEIENDTLSEILDGTYLPPVVEMVRVGSRRRERASVGGAYTRLPISARRDIHLGSSWT